MMPSELNLLNFREIPGDIGSMKVLAVTSVKTEQVTEAKGGNVLWFIQNMICLCYILIK